MADVETAELQRLRLFATPVESLRAAARIAPTAGQPESAAQRAAAQSMRAAMRYAPALALPAPFALPLAAPFETRMARRERPAAAVQHAAPSPAQPDAAVPAAAG